MHKRLIAIGVALFSFLLGELSADEFTLSYKDVRPTMEKMFAYHVESKTFSPTVVRRSFKVFLEQFDPDQVYLLKKEADVFCGLNDRLVHQVIKEYRYDNFSQYAYLNHAVQRAISRNQKLRAKIEKQLVNHPEVLLESLPDHGYYDYAKNEKELEKKLYIQMIKEIKYSLRKRHISQVSPQLIQKIVAHRSKKVASFEKAYMETEDKLAEHYLTLHMLKALAKSLDAHTGYYSPKEAYEIRASLKKQFSGVGVVLREDYDGVFVSDLIDGGPAHRSGQIQVGDLLFAANDRQVESITFAELLDVMKGRSGEKLTLGVKRSPEHSKVIYVDLIREKIIMNEERVTVSSEPYGDGIIGKVTLPAFYDNGEHVSVDKDLREALRALRSEGKLLGLVMDFRENSGGFLSQAIKVSGMFINGGLIVISKYADGEVSYARDVDGRQYYDGPLLILTSKASASAAEIVAQALQDYGVALIVGDERSYGKGSMQYQTLTDERAKAFFKVTVGRYYTASGRSPQIEGVKADVVVPTVFFPYNIGERYLEFPLANDHLSGEVFHSLMNIKKGSYRDLSRFVVPYLQPRETQWRKMLAQLVENSHDRIQNSQNFQYFLKVGNGYRPNRKDYQSRSDFKKTNFGVEDLQMKEAVEILKDMVMIQDEGAKQ